MLIYLSKIVLIVNIYFNHQISLLFASDVMNKLKSRIVKDFLQLLFCVQKKPCSIIY